MQLRIIQVGEPFTGDHHNIQSAQDKLIQTKRVSDQTLDAIALDSQLDALLADHHSQAGMGKSIFTNQKQH